MLASAPSQLESRRIPAIAWVIALVVAALLGVAFRQPIARMVEIWNKPESYYSHGWLVPFVALFIAWRQRGELAADPRPSWIGFWTMIAGLLILIVSGWLIVGFLPGFGLILTIWGICGFLLGWTVMKRLWFAAFILCFMVPPPEQFIVQSTLAMKLMATALAMRLLDLFGIVAVNDGQTIYLGDSFVTVGSACSGLRSLISLIFLGVLFARFSNLSWPRRIALAATSIPIAIVSNVARVVSLSLVAYFWGTNAVSGPVHDASGYLIFVVAFFLLYGAMWLLQWRRVPKEPAP